jgi:hypothetical protein
VLAKMGLDLAFERPDLGVEGLRIATVARTVAA